MSLVRGVGYIPGGGGHGSTPYKYMKIYIYSSKCDFPGEGVLSSTYFTEECPPITCNNSPIETVTSTVELVIFQGGVGWGLISFSPKFWSVHVQLSIVFKAGS